MLEKVLVLGSNGNFGHMCASYFLKKGYRVTTAARNNSDILINFENLEELKLLSLSLTDYDYVINCVGVLVADSEANNKRAFFLNSWFPHFLSSCMSNSDSKLIHISTDCVFNGIGGKPYLEDTPPNETKIYGYTKSLGEVNNTKDLTVRTSIIGPELDSRGTGLLNWFLTVESEEINGWSNHYWNGVTTLELARLLDICIQETHISGLYNLVDNKFKISKYALLKQFRKTFKKDIKIKCVETQKTIDKALFTSRQNSELLIKNFSDQMYDLKVWMDTDGRYYK